MHESTNKGQNMLRDIADGIQKGLNGKNFDGSLKFDCGEDGIIVLADNTALTDDRETDCTIRLLRDNLNKLLTGKLNPMTGVALGKLRISGNMGVAMKLGQLLGRVINSAHQRVTINVSTLQEVETGGSLILKGDQR